MLAAPAAQRTAAIARRGDSLTPGGSSSNLLHPEAVSDGALPAIPQERALTSTLSKKI
jgi:hypothetical protein